MKGWGEPIDERAGLAHFAKAAAAGDGQAAGRRGGRTCLRSYRFARLAEKANPIEATPWVELIREP